MTPFAQLTLIKTALAAAPGVVSCKIGLEAAITADDYPLVRIVLSRMVPQEAHSTRRQMELLIYFGAPVLEASDGLEKVYETLLAMETALRDRMTVGVVRAAREAGEYLKTQYLETVFDEDRLPPMYKIFAMRWRVEG